MSRHIIKIRDGKMEFIYSEKLLPLMEHGKTTIKRASHVEPVIVEGMTMWEADMNPVEGPKLGPYAVRSEALTAEVAWLEENHLSIAKCS